MLIEAARGGHTGVVGMLLRQPKFTETLRSQMMEQKQASICTSGECVVGAKRKNRPYSGGRIKKQQKSPAKVASPIDIVSNGVPPPTKEVNQGGNVQGSAQYVLSQGQKNFQFKTSTDYSTYHKQQHQLYMKQQQQLLTQQNSSVPASISPSHVFSCQQPPSLSLLNPTNPYAASIAEKIKASVKWTGDGQCECKGDLNEFTMNPSYQFAAMPPHSLVYPVYSPQAHPPLSRSSDGEDGGGNKEGVSYLLPNIFPQSPTYSNEEHMEAYMKADEILRNHMYQLDYAKQQALMSALESLMVQSEAHRASISGDSHEPLCNVSAEDPGSVSPASKANETPWSFTDPSRMPQFAVGVSTIAPSPEKQQPLAEVVQPPVQSLDKNQLAALQTQMLASLERSNLYSGNTCSSRSTPERSPVSIAVSSPENTTVDVLKSSVCRNTYFASPIVTPSPTTATGSQQTPVKQEYTVPHNSPNVTSDRLPSANTITFDPSVVLNQHDYFQPIYSQELSNLKHCVHLPDNGVATQQVPGPFLLDSNFQLDVPDHIPEHVSVLLFLHLV